jgi:tripartite-type tricarboxylate transporter receptor subunit TctC
MMRYLKQKLKSQKVKSVQSLVIIITALSAALSGGRAVAQTPVSDYPNHPIRLIVAYPPGGPVDIVGRTIAQALTLSMDRAVIVDNRAGASGIVGTDIAAKAPHDGYTLLLGSSANAILQSLYSKLPYDAQHDLVMIAGIGSAPFVLVTNPRVEAANVRELVALVKSRPGKFSYGSPGAGSPNHLSAELMKSMTGMDAVHVPYRGAAPAETDLMGGQISFMFDTIPSALPMVRSGKLRALAVTSAERSPAAPDIPTMAESGLTGYQTSTWYGLMGPTGIPPQIVARLDSEVNKALRNPDFLKRMASLGLQPMPGSSAQFTTFFDSEMGKWAKIVKASGTHLD